MCSLFLKRAGVIDNQGFSKFLAYAKISFKKGERIGFPINNFSEESTLYIEQTQLVKVSKNPGGKIPPARRPTPAS